MSLKRRFEIKDTVMQKFLGDAKFVDFVVSLLSTNFQKQWLINDR